MFDWDTTRGFLNERRDYLYVFVVPSPGDSRCWDVVVRMDGSYSQRQDAEAAARGIAEWIDNLADLRRDRRTWWEGPPWLRNQSK